VLNTKVAKWYKCKISPRVDPKPVLLPAVSTPLLHAVAFIIANAILLVVTGCKSNVHFLLFYLI
jgi:hypothetical protein